MCGVCVFVCIYFYLLVDILMPYAFLGGGAGEEVLLIFFLCVRTKTVSTAYHIGYGKAAEITSVLRDALVVSSAES